MKRRRTGVRGGGDNNTHDGDDDCRPTTACQQHGEQSECCDCSCSRERPGLRQVNGVGIEDIAEDVDEEVEGGQKRGGRGGPGGMRTPLAANSAIMVRQHTLTTSSPEALQLQLQSQASRTAAQLDEGGTTTSLPSPTWHHVRPLSPPHPC